MFALIAGASTSATRATLPRLRFRLRFLFCNRWRLPFLRRSTLPDAVNLNRLETAFRVLAMPAFLDIGAERVEAFLKPARAFWKGFSRLGLCGCWFGGWMGFDVGAVVGS
jgi:hypothetical protein